MGAPLFKYKDIIKKNNIILITSGHFKEKFNNINYKTITLFKDKNNIYRDKTNTKWQIKKYHN